MTRQKNQIQNFQIENSSPQMTWNRSVFTKSDTKLNQWTFPVRHNRFIELKTQIFSSSSSTSPLSRRCCTFPAGDGSNLKSTRRGFPVDFRLLLTWVKKKSQSNFETELPISTVICRSHASQFPFFQSLHEPQFHLHLYPQILAAFSTPLRFRTQDPVSSPSLSKDHIDHELVSKLLLSWLP